jgi:DNA-binding response OmpR family regulator
MHKHYILLADGDGTLCDLVSHHLLAAGFNVDNVADGFSAIDSSARTHPDLVVLDRALPRVDGLTACRSIRFGQGIPVIMIAARNAVADRIEGLEAGADDYLAKPFSPRELVLRAQSVLRRATREPLQSSVETIGDFRLDIANRLIAQNGAHLALTQREFDLLAFLILRHSQVIHRDELMRNVWGWDFGDSSTVTVHVRRLREKIELDPAHPHLLQTVRGLGYRLDIE